MLSKKISAIFMLAILLLLTVTCFIRASLLNIPFPDQDQGGLVSRTEQFLSEAFPLSRTLNSLRVDLRYLLGEREQDGIFITQSRLIENIPKPTGNVVQENTDAIIDFTQRHQVPTFIMLIPSASMIFQSQTPPSADIFNQKRFIENRYTNFSGKLSCVDVYSTLLRHSDKALYFNTESLLTMQGGYFVYDVLTRRMGGKPYPLDRFEIQYLTSNFYGSLYDRVEYKDVAPDVLAVYRFNGNKEFLITHNGEPIRQYNTLFPSFLLDLGRPLDVYLGGQSAIVDIQQKQQRSKNKLLIFGDQQILSVLPFLACDYQLISLIDLEQASSQQLGNIDFSSYDEILFAYSVDTFIHSDTLSRIGLY